jgi:MoaA/NifB/PqqE/SkfB family radical SAM enzyme
LFKKTKIALGIMAGRVFTGPLEVSIDITNRCNVGCITCWFYSPLRTDKVDSGWAVQQMEYDTFTRIIDEFCEMGVERVMVGGSGEPFCHPKIIDMIEYAKKAGMMVDSATSGVYFGEDNLRRLYDARLDSLNMSILAATPATYMKMHPRQKENAYEAIIRSLKLLSKWKNEDNLETPAVNLVYVVCSLNYQEVDQIVNLACEYKVESVQFKRLATMPFTESLLLKKDQLIELDRLMAGCAKKAREHGLIVNTDEFRKLVVHGMANGDYSSKIYSMIPCYIGWIYSRVLCDGSVVPCCGCTNYALGNINKQSFKTIWFSDEYSRFRKESREIMSDKSITRRCACHSCAHVLMNQGIHRKIHPFSLFS